MKFLLFCEIVTGTKEKAFVKFVLRILTYFINFSNFLLPIFRNIKHETLVLLRKLSNITSFLACQENFPENRKILFDIFVLDRSLSAFLKHVGILRVKFLCWLFRACLEYIR